MWVQRATFTQTALHTVLHLSLLSATSREDIHTSEYVLFRLWSIHSKTVSPFSCRSDISNDGWTRYAKEYWELVCAKVGHSLELWRQTVTRFARSFDYVIRCNIKLAAILRQETLNISFTRFCFLKFHPFHSVTWTSILKLTRGTWLWNGLASNTAYLLALLNTVMNLLVLTSWDFTSFSKRLYSTEL
jgi:hypothetical protein